MQESIFTIRKLLFIVLLSFPFILWGQSNNVCGNAFHINDVEGFCSAPGQFSNVGASASAVAEPMCWPQGTNTNDVWFSFAPTAPGMYIQLIGNTGSGQGSLNLPSMEILAGVCSSLNEIACGSTQPGQENIVEITLTDLLIGQIYYIRVDGRQNNVGDFTICLDAFIPVPVPESDCDKAVVLCDKSPFFIENLSGVGEDVNEVNGSCVQSEFASVWYKWTCENPGSLTFTLTPNNAPDDLDFAVYRLPSGIDECTDKELLRCMASGETIGAPAAQNQPCMGATGLSLQATDNTETPGCQAGDDNFVAAINMVAGESYALIVNNFSRSGFGFNIQFGGTGTFLGPVPDFVVDAVQAFECDKTIIFTNQSESLTDSIVSLSWNFGVGSTPSFSTGEGPHDVIYESFGPKLAALTIESSRGCQVTKILDLFVEPCCADTSTLRVEANIQDLICAGVPDGLISATGFNGSPQYSYSLDGEVFQPSSIFGQLFSGIYDVFIQDQKGCRDTIEVFVDEPPPLVVDAGVDTSVDLGFSIDLMAIYTPAFVNVSPQWFPPDGGVVCDTCLTTTVVPPGTTTYEILVTDDTGCTATDQVTVRVEIKRPIYAPNAISPNSDLYNDFFNLFGGPAVQGVDLIQIYDRWGNLVYEGQNVPINDEFAGWDGKFNDQYVNPGVFAWLAIVTFIDGVSIEFAGDVTVFR
jgi:gliding motility-associated-like protein